MQNFDAYGHLQPYQVMESDIEAVYKDFVTVFTTSKTRQQLFENYVAYNKALKAALGNTDYEQWLDGSFVTTKINPNDMDIVTFIPLAVYEKYADSLLPYENQNAKRTYNVDPYFVIQYPEAHKRYSWYVGDRNTWLDSFGYTKPLKSAQLNGKRQPKGIIQLYF